MYQLLSGREDEVKQNVCVLNAVFVFLTECVFFLTSLQNPLKVQTKKEQICLFTVINLLCNSDFQFHEIPNFFYPSTLQYTLLHISMCLTYYVIFFLCTFL